MLYQRVNGTAIDTNISSEVIKVMLLIYKLLKIICLTYYLSTSTAN